ncbi:hypothetical protein [Limimaricola cinnabarinus]|uniref:hypothetical protein n=1 Tax=Limimaricola cinnabarinus TaxID=1125964 RepID=UPI0024909DAB|nr:hypothetical protein [Limimaricola cinnabarinus]
MSCPDTRPAPHALVPLMPLPEPSPQALLRARLLAALGGGARRGPPPSVELRTRMMRLEAHLAACAFGRLRADARGLRRLALRLGLSEMARVAASVEECAARGDAAALGATVARLGRCGAGALSALRRSG